MYKYFSRKWKNEKIINFNQTCGVVKHTNNLYRIILTSIQAKNNKFNSLACAHITHLVHTSINLT